MPILFSFVSRLKNVMYFHVRQLERPEIAFQKRGFITFRYLFFLLLHSEKQRYCFEIWDVCCLYAGS